MASDVKWFKFMNGMFDDEKIEYIESLPDGDAILIIWIRILCLASKCNENGLLMISNEIPYTPDLLAHKFKKTTTQVEYALGIMKKLKMIDIFEDIICVSNWAKYQSVDELAKIREQTRLRVAKCRENKKLIECNATSNATVTQNCNDFALISNSISNIFNYWNDKNIIKHKELNQDTKKAIEKALKTYKEEEIKEYIDRYNKVLKDKDWYFDTKWTLAEFLKQKNGISNFTDEGSKWINYLKHYEKSAPNCKTQQNDDYVNVDISYIGKYGETVFDVYPRKKGQTEWTEEDKERILKEKGGKRWIF